MSENPDTEPTSLSVDLGNRSYPIHIGSGLINEAGPLLAPIIPSGRAFIITDENVAPLYLSKLQNSLTAAGITHHHQALPAGEGTKSFSMLEHVLDNLLAAKAERSTSIIALGGGVIGDLAGFASAIMMRGTPFIQIPTTLLAQVDSSVGGKTGINTAHGKNLVGAFHQPIAVLADTDSLNSLPKRELLAGYAEVVKYGLIDEPGFFEWLENNGQCVISGDLQARRHAILTSCRAKARVVAADERESGQRALLNLGHTFGHALEAEAGYSGQLLHGEAVAIGMIMALDLSVSMGLCPAADLQRTIAHFRAVGLPVYPADIEGVNWPDAQVLAGHTATDKKVKDGKVTFVLARGIGQSFLCRDVSLSDTIATFHKSLVQ